MTWPTCIPTEEEKMRAALAPTFLDHLCELQISSKASFIRNSSIICTIGPASMSVNMLEQMIETGMNIAALNFSHGTYEYHSNTIKNIREAEQNYSKKVGSFTPIAIALDFNGLVLKTGIIADDPNAQIELIKGDMIKITGIKEPSYKCTAEELFINYRNLTDVISNSDEIYLDDGLISLRVIKRVPPSSLFCLIEKGGMLGNKKTVNLPGKYINLLPLCGKDRADLVFGVNQIGIDMVFASFIQNAAEVNEIREILGDEGKNIMVISKIENQTGMENLDSIIEVSDGIMVARSNLGLNISPEKVFLAQKSIIAKCNKKGKPVICATQMLESMIKKPRATCAESSDVANAILDGADCVMLSGETAKGDYPLECVRTMEKICRKAEAAIWHKQLFENLVSKMIPPIDATHSVAIAAVEASAKALAAAILVITSTGRSAHLIAKYRPRCPIIAVTRHIQVARQAHLFRSILPVYFEKAPFQDWLQDIEERIKFGLRISFEKKFFTVGDPIVIVTGWKHGSAITNTIRLFYCPEDINEKSVINFMSYKII